MARKGASTSWHVKEHQTHRTQRSINLIARKGASTSWHAKEHQPHGTQRGINLMACNEQKELWALAMVRPPRLTPMTSRAERGASGRP